MSVVDPVTGRRSWASREEYNAFIASLPAPTSDDVTVLADGTRIDTAEKGLAYAAQLRAQLEAAHARDAAVNDSGVGRAASSAQPVSRRR